MQILSGTDSRNCAETGFFALSLTKRSSGTVIALLRQTEATPVYGHSRKSLPKQVCGNYYMEQ